MTPLAQRVLRDAMLPPERRLLETNGAELDLPSALIEARCFELTAVIDLIPPLGMRLLDADGDGVIEGPRDNTLAFLPAPTTWCEYAGSGMRLGMLMQEADPFILMHIVLGWEGRLAICGVAALPISGQHFGEVRATRVLAEGFPQHRANHIQMDAFPILAMINSPGVVRQRLEPPHKGLQRDLVRAGLLARDVPIARWSEVLLDVDPPPIEGEPKEARLQGDKALHFCRAHLRIARGRLVRVRGHWRGDSSKGVVLSRYRLRPPGTEEAK